MAYWRALRVGLMVGFGIAGSSGTERGVAGDSWIGVERVSPRDLGEVKMRTWVGILVSQSRASSVERRDVGADVQAAQSGAVEVVAVLKTVRRHSTGNAACKEKRQGGS
jgi:hypothetical protein